MARTHAVSLMYHDVVDGLEHQRSGFPSTDAAIYKLEPVEFVEHMKAISLVLQGPQKGRLLPVIVGATEMRNQLDVSITESGVEIVLKAVPKRQADKACFRQIDVILDAKTYITIATQVVSPNGREWIVHVLSDSKVNRRPRDRDQLVSPNLSGLRVSNDL